MLYFFRASVVLLVELPVDHCHDVEHRSSHAAVPAKAKNNVFVCTLGYSAAGSAADSAYFAG